MQRSSMPFGYLHEFLFISLAFGLLVQKWLQKFWTCYLQNSLCIFHKEKRQVLYPHTPNRSPEIHPDLRSLSAHEPVNVSRGKVCLTQPKPCIPNLRPGGLKLNSLNSMHFSNAENCLEEERRKEIQEKCSQCTKRYSTIFVIHHSCIVISDMQSLRLTPLQVPLY